MTEHIMSEKDKQVARIMQDPALWAEHHLGDKPRWYQEQTLRHPHNRIALRWGRRLGKCIAEGQSLVDPDTGRRIRVEELYQKGPARAFSLDNHFKIAKEDLFAVEKNGIKEVFRVTLKGGDRVELTGNHPLYTIEGWKEVDDLKVKDYIATPNHIPVFGSLRPMNNRPKILAYLLHGTKKTKMGMVMDLSNDETRQGIFEDMRGAGIPIYPKTKVTFFVLDKEKKYQEAFKEDVTIPDEVYEYDQESLAKFIAASFDVRGHVMLNRKPEIGFSSYNQQTAREMKHLLLRFGIETVMRSNKGRGNEKDSYTVYVNRGETVTKYIDLIGKYSYRDFSKLKERAEEITSYMPTVPKEIVPYIQDKGKEKGLKPTEVSAGIPGNYLRKNRPVNTEHLMIYANNLKDEYLYDMATSDISWKEIVSIESIGEKMTYDVMMPKYHNLIIEDIFVHNTWTMSAHMLWSAFTNMGGKKKNGKTICLVATPYDSQALLIYKQLMDFINDSKVLTESLKRSVKNPYNIEFKNGSEIRLFTTGAKTSSGGANIRGQRADYIYMDEMD